MLLPKTLFVCIQRYRSVDVTCAAVHDCELPAKRQNFKLYNFNYYIELRTILQ
jgi:hypothetical protein